MRLTKEADERRAKLSRKFLQIRERSVTGTAKEEDGERLSMLLAEYRDLLKDPNNLEKARSGGNKT